MHGSLRYILIGVAVLAVGFLSALWVFSGNWSAPLPLLFRKNLPFFPCFLSGHWWINI